MTAAWLDTLPLVGQASRLDRARALASRPDLEHVVTGGGPLRVRRARATLRPRFLIATDGPLVIEHHDALLAALHGRADVIVFEPPGTGGSPPARGFDFSLDAFARVTLELLDRLGPCVLVFPCYLGFVAQEVARRRPEAVRALVLPQTPSWSDMAAWTERVDPRHLLRTPILGQLAVAARRRSIAHGWFRASLGARERRPAFIAAADEAFARGACFCLASLIQGLAGGPSPRSAPVPVPSAIVWGERDRTHAGADPDRALPGARVVRFAGSGHSPNLEEPERFAAWLLDFTSELTP